MPRLHPHNSISNVVASVTIHDDMFICMYISKNRRDVAKTWKPLWKVKGFFNRTSWKVSDVQIVRNTWVLSSCSVSVSVSLSLCVVCCCGARGCGGGGGGREGERREERD